MSRYATSNAGPDETVSHESGLAALRASPAFRGPAEPLEDHDHANDHFALVYESQDEQFAAAIPFIRQGLERDERCLYITFENSREEVLAAMRDYGIDVDAALESGQLSIHDEQETYLRNETFDADETVAFIDAAIEDATEEYEALRMTGEMSSVLAEDPGCEELVKCEAKANYLFDDVDGLALCQYNRERFPAEVIRDVLNTHPLLVHDGRISHNVYYTPPEEFFGDERAEREVERLLGSLRERTDAKAALRESEEQLRALIDVLPVGVFVADGDGRIVEWNDAAEEIWGGDVPDATSVAEYDRYRGWWADTGEPVDAGEWALARALRGEAVTDPEEIEIEGFDGERRTVLNHGVPVRDADGEVTRAVAAIVDITERKTHERYLRELSEITADPELATDEKIERVLEVGCERLDLPVGTFERDHGTRLEVERVPEGRRALADGSLAAAMDQYSRQVADSGGPVTISDTRAADEATALPTDEAGLRTYVGIPVVVGGDAYGTLCFADTAPRDGTFTDAERGFLDLMAQCVGYEIGRRRRESRLNLLDDVGRELLDAETAEAVAEGVVAATEDAFEEPVVAVGLYDQERGDLQPAARTDAAEALLAETSLFDRADGAGWRALIDGEPKRVADPIDRDGAVDSRDVAVSEAYIHPLGGYGVYVVGATAPDGFRRGDVGVIETGAASIRAALDRTDRELQLQERERALEAQNETLERMNRVNDTIRTIVKSLVEANTRDEIERVVCEELARTGPYELAWIGAADEVAGEVTPVESAGAEKGYLEDVTIILDESPEGHGPTGRALETGEPQFVDNILEDRSFEPWRQDALNRGYHATAAFPLTYDNTRFGVLNVYAGQPDVFDSLEREVLTELSDTVAHALNTIETKKALVSDHITELEFTVDDRNLGVVDLARELECEFEHMRLVPQADGGVRAFFAVRGAAASEVLAFEPRLPVSDLRVVSNPDDGPNVFEAAVTDESLTATVVDHGGRLRQVHVEDGTASVVVHLAADADVREFVEMFRATYPDSELTAQRTDAVPERTPFEFVTALTEELTDRQEEMLRTAYFNGYFEEPRARTASEIAESMDISQPTFNSHLRAAMRKLCRHIYEPDTDRA
jgi:GAF domain-containing protein/PAS domain-containing protein/DNA-binding CsgD family transcriptional regulator